MNCSIKPIRAVQSVPQPPIAKKPGIPRDIPRSSSESLSFPGAKEGLAYRLSGGVPEGGGGQRAGGSGSAPPAGGSGRRGGGSPFGLTSKEILLKAGISILQGTRSGIDNLGEMEEELIIAGLAQRVPGGMLQLNTPVWLRGAPELAIQNRAYNSYADLERVLIALEKSGRLAQITVEQFIPSAYLIDVNFVSEEEAGELHFKEIKLYPHKRGNGILNGGSADVLAFVQNRQALVDLSLKVVRAVEFEGKGAIKFLTASEAGPFYLLKFRGQPFWEKIEEELCLWMANKKLWIKQVPMSLKVILQRILKLPDPHADRAEQFLLNIPKDYEEILKELVYSLQKEGGELADFVAEWWIRRFRPDLVIKETTTNKGTDEEEEGV